MPDQGPAEFSTGTSSRRDPGEMGVRRLQQKLASLFAARETGYAALQSILLQALTLGANLVTGVLTARLLGAEGRGLYAAAIGWPTVLGMAAVAGTADALLVQLRRRPDRAASTIAVGAGIAFALSTLLCVVVFLALPLLLGRGHEAALTTARWALACTYVMALGALARQIFAGRQRFLLSNLAAFLPHLFHALAVCAVAAADRLTVGTAVACLMLGNALSLAVLTPALLSGLRQPLRNLRGAAEAIGGFARRAAPGDLIALCVGWGDRLVLIPLLSPQQLGLYVVAFGFSRIITIATPATGIMLSAMTGGPPESAKSLHDLSIRCSLALMLAIIGVVFVFDEPILQMFYGSGFVPAQRIFEILVVQSAINRIANTTSQFYSAANRPELNSRFRLVDMAVSLAGMLFLAPRWGAEGAALGLLAGTTLRLALLWSGFVIHLRMSFPRLWLAQGDLRLVQALFRT